MALAINPKARFDYDILETIEAGLVLLGHEVKSVRKGAVSIKGAYVKIMRGPSSAGASAGMEAWLVGSTITPYQPKNIIGEYDPQRSRKLLIRKSELNKLIGKSQEAGLTLVPLSLYTKGRRIKLELGVGRGKKKYDKRETIKKRESDRNIRRQMKSRF